MRILESLRILRLVLTPAGLLRASRTQRPALDVSPWAERTISARVGGEHRFLELAGPSPDAPVMLLLPGGMVDHRIWVNTAALASRFRLLAFDYPDQSPHYRGEFEGFGDTVMDFLECVGVDRLYCAGVSAGGLVALDVATRWAERLTVDGLCLVSTNLMSIDEEEISTRARMSRWALSMPPEKLRAIVEYVAMRSATHAADSRFQQDEFFYVRSAAYYVELFTWMKARGRKRQDTHRVRCPTMSLHGNADRILPIRIARLTQEHLPNVQRYEFRELDGYGHEMIFSHGPELAEMMLEFFAREHA